MSSNNVGHLITKTITILQRFTTHHRTSSKLHFTTLIDTSLPLIYTSLPSHDGKLTLFLLTVTIFVTTPYL